MASLTGVSEGSILDGRYRLEELLGRGGTAEVYRATDELLGRAVAVKVFDSRLSDLNTVVRQRNEMRVLATLNHPNLIAVYDARIAGPSGSDRPARADPGMTSSGHTYLVMELVQGTTLADLLSRGPMPAAEVVRLGFVLSTVLETVHGGDLVHRDIKPANILLADAGPIKLGDFGLARILTAENRLTTGGEVMGTAAYFSPEQARGGEVGPSADIYSLGLVLLECLTGAKEFPGQPVESAVARLLRDPAVPDDLAQPWPALLSAMTNSNPALRPTAAQVAETLQPLFAGQPDRHSLSSTASGRSMPLTEGPTAGWSTPLSPFMTVADSAPTRRRRRRAGLVIAGGTGIAAAVAIGFVISQSGATGPIGTPEPAAASPTASTPATPTSFSRTVRPAPTAAARTKPAPTVRSSTVLPVAVVTSTNKVSTSSKAAPTPTTTSRPAGSSTVLPVTPPTVPAGPLPAPTSATPTISAPKSTATSADIKATKTKAPKTKAPKAVPPTKPKKPKK